jgi:hypothetical protein
LHSGGRRGRFLRRGVGGGGESESRERRGEGDGLERATAVTTHGVFDLGVERAERGEKVHTCIADGFDPGLFLFLGA